MPEDSKTQETDKSSSNFSENPDGFETSLQKFQIALKDFIHPPSLSLLQLSQNQLTAFRKLRYFQKIERVEFEQQRRIAETEIKQLRPLPTTQKRLGVASYAISELPLIAQPLIKTMMEEERVIKLKMNEMQEIIDEQYERLRQKAEEAGESLTDGLPTWFEKAYNSLKEHDEEVAERFVSDGITQGEMSSTLRIIVDALIKDPESREKINEIQRDLEKNKLFTINEIIAFTNRKKDRLRVNQLEAMLRVETNLDEENSLLNGIEDENEKGRLTQLRNQSSSINKAADRANSVYNIYLNERQSAYQDLHKALNDLLRWLPLDNAISLQLQTLFRLDKPGFIGIQIHDAPAIHALEASFNDQTLFLESSPQTHQLQSFNNGYENSTILSKEKYKELLNPYEKSEKGNSDKIKTDLFKHLRFNAGISDLIGIFLGQSDSSSLNFNEELQSAFTEALTGLESDETFLAAPQNSEELKSSQWAEKSKTLHEFAVNKITKNFKKKRYSEVFSKVKNDRRFIHSLREEEKEKIRQIARQLHSANDTHMDLASYTKLFLKNSDALINEEVNARIGKKIKETIDKIFANDLEQYLKKHSSQLLINQIEFDYVSHQLEMIKAWQSKGKDFEKTHEKWKSHQQTLIQQRNNCINSFFISSSNWLKERDQDIALPNIDFSNQKNQVIEIRQELQQTFQAYQSNNNPFELPASTILSIEGKVRQTVLSFQRLGEHHQKEIQLRLTNSLSELNTLIDIQTQKITSLKIKTGQEDKFDTAVKELEKLQVNLQTKLQGLNKPSLKEISSLYTDIAKIEKEALQQKVRIEYLVIRASISRIDEITSQYKNIAPSNEVNVNREDPKERLTELGDIRKFLRNQEKEIRAYFDKDSFDAQSSDALMTEQTKQRENADIEFHIISNGLIARRMTLEQQKNKANASNFPFVKLMDQEGRELSILNEGIHEALEKTNKLHKNLLNEEGEEIYQNDAMHEANEYLQNEHQNLPLNEDKIKAFQSKETQLWQEHIAAMSVWIKDVETELTTITVGKSSIKQALEELKVETDNIKKFHFSSENPVPLARHMANIFIDKQRTLQSELDEIIIGEIYKELGEAARFSLRNPDSEKFSAEIATLTNMNSAYVQGQRLAKYGINDFSSTRQQFRQSMDMLNQVKTEIHKLKLATLATRIETVEQFLAQDGTVLPPEKSEILVSLKSGVHDQTTQINEYQQKNETRELNKLVKKSKRDSEIKDAETEINNIEATALQLRLEKQLLEREAELNRLSLNANITLVEAQLKELREAVNGFQNKYVQGAFSSLEDNPAFKELEEKNHQIRDGIKKLAHKERENFQSSFKRLKDTIGEELTEINNFVMKDSKVKDFDSMIQGLKEIETSADQELATINSTELISMSFSSFDDKTGELKEEFIRAKVETHKLYIETFLGQIGKIDQIAGELEPEHSEIAKRLDPIRTLLNDQVAEIDKRQDVETNEREDMSWEDILGTLKEEVEPNEMEVKIIDISLQAHQLLLEKQLWQTNSANFPSIQLKEPHALSAIQNEIFESLQMVKELRTEFNSEAENDQAKELMHKAFKFIQSQFSKAEAIQKEINSLQLKEQESKKRKRTDEQELDIQKPEKRQDINIPLNDAEKQIAKNLITRNLLDDNYRVTNSIPSEASDLFPLNVEKQNGQKVILCAIRPSSNPNATFELKKYTAAELIKGFNWTKDMVNKKLRNIVPMIEENNKGTLKSSLKATPRKHRQATQSSSAQQQATPSKQSSPPGR